MAAVNEQDSTVAASSQMQGIVLHGVGDLRLDNVKVPQAGPGEVRVRIGYCGVCGSDLPRCFSKGTYSFPTICGHEFAGTVESCGEGATKFSPGDQVVVFPLIWDPNHPACETGNYAQSDGYDYLGSRSDGAFSEYVVAPEQNLILVPEGVTLEEAAMTEPAAVALHAVKRAKPQMGETAAVFGIGPIGLMVAQWLQLAGVNKIFLIDVQAAKLALAKRLGFENTLDASTQDVEAILNEQTSGNGVHIAIEAAGVPPTLISAIKSTRRTGRVILLGNPAADVTLPAPLISQAMRREIDLLGVWNSEFRVHSDDDDWRTVLNTLAKKQLNLELLITHRVPLSEGIKALEMMRDQSEFYVKVLLHP